MAATSQNGIRFAGEVSVQELILIGANGKTIDLTSFLVELNIMEDIFSPCLYGNIMLSDSINVIEHLPVIGEEYLRVKVDTPGMGVPIYKSFRVYSVSDSVTVLDDKTQGFILHFCSPEVFTDILNKIYRTYSGNINDVATKIYYENIMTARNIVANGDGRLVDSGDTTNLNLTDIPSNSVKFTSPGWGAIKCMSWLAAKALSAKFKSADFLFFESSKQFYFASISSIINAFKSKNLIGGDYYYKQSNIRDMTGNVMVNGVQYTQPNTMREYSIVESFRIIKQFNTLKNTNEGYYGSQMISLNLITKSFTYNEFDYGANFDTYTHVEKYPMFSKYQFSNPQSYIIQNIQQTGLYDGQSANTNETAPTVQQNRLSLLQGITNLVIEIAVPGHTDMEVGCVVNFTMPKLGPKDTSDTTNEAKDKYLSGLYLVSALRHKITLDKHMMIMELAKDSTGNEYK
jgi:hypothetical protein